MGNNWLVVDIVFNAGFTDGDQAQLLPFYRCTMPDVLGHKKVIYTQYTFAKADSFQRKLDYENPLGEYKCALFERLGGVRRNVLRYMGDTGEKVTADRIRKCLNDAEDGDCILFAWSRSNTDEKPFYQALDLMEGGAPNPQACSLVENPEAEGLSLAPPFQFIPMDQLTQR
ncbi:hypothetical protein [Neptuniibacter sp. QD37_11]|uniref:hypothetical protein n=1 Tax=Neptuniibacter sp. QD37_11 TaxID=3398209 RepID=UPI0039F6471F